MSKYSVDKWIMEFETIQFQFRGDDDKIVHWVLTNPEIPEANKNAILKRYGYEPQQIDSGMDTVKRKPGRPKKDIQ
jgi:hypothetical protein